MEPSLPPPPVPAWLRLVPWAVLPTALLPLLLLLVTPQSAVARAAIMAGESFRAISIARLFEGGSPAPSALTLAVFDWQSLTGLGLLALGLLAIVASVFHTRDGKLVAKALPGLLAMLIVPAMIGLLLIGPGWAGYDMPTHRMALVHVILAAGGWILGQASIGVAVRLWSLPQDQLPLRAGAAAPTPGPVARRGRMNRIALGSNRLEGVLRLFPVLLALAAWAGLRFQSALPDALLLAFIDGGAIVRPLALLELIGWIPRGFADLDPLLATMLLAFLDWQGFALSLAVCCAVALLVLDWRRASAQQRLTGFATSAVRLGLVVASFWWLIGEILPQRLDLPTWQPEIATAAILFGIFAMMGGSKPKQDVSERNS